MVVLSEKPQANFLAGPKENRPVLLWAALGAAMLVLAIYIFGSWMLSGDWKPIPVGPTPVPTWMQWNAYIQEVLSTIAFCWMAWHFVIRPWRRDGEVGWDGMIYICCILFWWQDALYNMLNTSFMYSKFLVNVGSWYNHVPGWILPNYKNFPEVPLFGLTWYSFGVCGIMIFGCWQMRKIQERWPNMSKLGLVGMMMLIYMLIDAPMEFFYNRTAIMTYPGAVHGWTLFQGHYYQFPLYEWVLWPMAWTAWTCLRYFKNDKGESIVERGIEKLNLGRKGKWWVRFLALLGGMNFIFFFFYNVPDQAFVVHSGTWPKDSLKRSYITNGYCGAGTDYACPGQDIPINRPNSLHLDPNGKVVVPEGAVPPTEVPFVTGKP